MPAVPLRKAKPKPKPERKTKTSTRVNTSAEPRLSRTRRPETLPVSDWQAALRRQFGLRNLGTEPVFSTFRGDNPDSGTHYRVTIRALEPGRNDCNCWDYATNHLGTCKHIEFALARLQARRGGKAALARGHAAAYSEIRLEYLGARQLRLHPGSACPPRLLKQARQSFDPAAGWALPFSRLGDVSTLARAARGAGHELRVGDEGALCGAARAGRSRPAGAASGAVRRGRLLPHRQLRDAGARRRSHRCLVA
jgi:hypothetical protein